LLGRDLRGRRQMLQHATAADAEMWATWRHAIGRGFQDSLGARFIEVTMLADQVGADTLARQCIGHEHGLAVDVRNTTPVVGKITDKSFEDDVAWIAHPRILPDVSNPSRSKRVVV